ncbi:MAG: hypothetical protein RLZZ380_1384 [Actinomycetota bacterium]|jgi:hypothetical protein
MQFDNTQTVFTKVLKLGSLLIATIAVLGSVIGFFAAGLPGLFGALAGAAIALIFVSLTALSVLLGSKLSLGGFYGVVLGGWLLKMVLFMVAISVLKGIEGLNGVAVFGTLVASILGSLAVDGFVVTKSKIPAVS